MSNFVSSVNFILGHGLNCCQSNSSLLMLKHKTEISCILQKWESSVRVRFLNISSRCEMRYIYRRERKAEISESVWIWDLAFLVDITELLNDLNVRLQGKWKLLLETLTDLKAFKIKLNVLMKHITEKKLSHLPSCKNILSEDGVNFTGQVYWGFVFQERFKAFYKYSEDYCLFQNPFEFDTEIY